MNTPSGYTALTWGDTVRTTDRIIWSHTEGRIEEVGSSVRVTLSEKTHCMHTRMYLFIRPNTMKKDTLIIVGLPTKENVKRADDVARALGFEPSASNTRWHEGELYKGKPTATKYRAQGKSAIGLGNPHQFRQIELNVIDLSDLATPSITIVTDGTKREVVINPDKSITVGCTTVPAATLDAIEAARK